jgi:ADP-heptose:LPS heptosyltransferase
MATTLIIRLSSLGDVAITIPVVYSVAANYPDDHFLLLTNSAWQSLFVNKPSNLTVFPVYTKSKHKGIVGIIRLLRELSHVVKAKELKIADLHGVIRSFLIDYHFKFRGSRLAIINKGRKEKRELVRQKHKILLPVKTSLNRYREVFEKLGYDSSVCFNGLFSEKPLNEKIQIGIAPFARHRGKIYSLNKMEEVIRQLNELPDIQITLWGSKKEKKLLEHWAKTYKNVTSVAGQMLLQGELVLMNQMDLMVSMDSANMHLASLVNTPVVSIWGATHLYAGFYGFSQDESNAIQVDLPCRPCSIYGNKPCSRDDYACLKQITPEMIVKKIQSVMEIHRSKLFK